LKALTNDWKKPAVSSKSAGGFGKKTSCISKLKDANPEGILKGRKSTGGLKKLEDILPVPIDT